jgi:NitT/TauT family transport system permease protein
MTRAIAILRRLLFRLWPPAVLIGAWYLWVDLRDVSSIVMPRPAAVARDLANDPSAYLDATLTTLRVAGLGLMVGLFLAVTLAVLSWTSDLLAGLLTPATVMLYAIPVVGLIPVVARVLGYNERTVVAIAVIITFFPTFVFVSSGLRAFPPGSGSVFDVLGARRSAVLWRLALPAALPNALIALRMSAPACLIGAVVAQYLMGTDGLGYAFMHSYTRFEMDRAFGVAIVVMVVSLVLFGLASRVERWGRERWT